MKKSQGIGLLEIMLALAVAAVILVISVRYYGNVKQQQKLTSASIQVTHLYDGMSKCLSAQDVCTDVSTLASKSYISQSDITSPWGKGSNSVNLQAASALTNVCQAPSTLPAGVYIQVQIKAIPNQNTCCNLANRIKASNVAASGCQSASGAFNAYVYFITG